MYQIPTCTVAKTSIDGGSSDNNNCNIKKYPEICKIALNSSACVGLEPYFMVKM